MVLNGTKLEELSGRFLNIVSDNGFTLTILNWDEISDDTRIKILRLLDFDEESEDLADNYCTAAIIIPHKNAYLDFDNCWLHISTIGHLSDLEMVNYIRECFMRPEVEFEGVVKLEPSEKIAILGKVIPSIDMREVI